MDLFSVKELESARSKLSESNENLISAYIMCKPDDRYFLRTNPEVVDQMEVIERQINKGNKLSDEELRTLVTQLIDFLVDWFPQSLEEDEEIELSEQLNQAMLDLNAFIKIHEVIKMKTKELNVDNQKERLQKPIEVILYNLQSGVYNRISFNKATRQDGYVYSASHVDLDESVVVRILQDRLIVLLWEHDLANQFGDNCATKTVRVNGNEKLYKQISYEILISDIHCVSDGTTRTFRIF